jgi:aconitate hydratase
MGGTVTEKILERHLASGTFKQGTEIAIRIDQTLTQDATGTMAYLQFEALGIPQVKTQLSVSYVDHNTLQTGFENADDHAYLESVADKYGILFSKAGNGICHQVHLERFAKPGATLLGSDSHTPTAGGIGSLAIGAGGLDIASAMAGQPFYFTMPQIVGIRLNGKLKDYVSAKDVILFLLKEFTVKGGVGKIFEYFGEGVKHLSVPERATIANMGTELGLTTSIFPSDEVTRRFLKAQNRENDFEKIMADKDAHYSSVVEINLDEIEPMIAKPHSPDNVVRVDEVAGKKIDQVLIGSCTNSSYKDLMMAASLLKGKKVNSGVSFGIAPGSRQVLSAIAKNGALSAMISAGARILESACGFCIGMGQSPKTGAVSLRTSNRNFRGRSGTKSAGIYLCSVETAVASALTGKITNPRSLKVPYAKTEMPEKFDIDDSMILRPSGTREVVKGPNIAELPLKEKLGEELTGEVLIKVGDNITTDDILPAGAKILPLRSNIPAISEYVFCNIDKAFTKKAKEKNGGFIIGGENYGQGSSREHVALAPMYLGIKAIIAKSFARIHRANLINFGILPLEFADKEDYANIKEEDKLVIRDVIGSLKEGKELKVEEKNIQLQCNLSSREKEIVIAGGKLNFIKERIKNGS